MKSRNINISNQTNIPQKNYENTRAIRKLVKSDLSQQENTSFYQAVDSMTCSKESQFYKTIDTKVRAIHDSIQFPSKKSFSKEMYQVLMKNTKHKPFLKEQFNKTFKNSEGYQDKELTTLFGNIAGFMNSEKQPLRREGTKLMTDITNGANMRRMLSEEILIEDQGRGAKKMSLFRKQSQKMSSLIRKASFNGRRRKHKPSQEIRLMKAAEIIGRKVRKDLVTQRSIGNTVKMNKIDMKNKLVRFLAKDKSLKEVQDRILINLNRSQRMEVGS